MFKTAHLPKLNSRHLKLLRFIESYVDSNGVSPDLFQLREYLGVATLATVHSYLAALEANGRLVRDGAGRGISYALAGASTDSDEIAEPVFIQVPMVGTITAGAPIEAIELQDGKFVSVSLPGGNHYYALEVRGDSMQDCYIFDGDVVILEKRTHADNGEVVVALDADGNATLKKLYRERESTPEGKHKDIYKLQPANPNYEPRYLQSGELEVQGVLVGVL